MPYMTALKPALIRFGLGPYLEEVPGWETRGSSSFAPACTLGHHTAGPLSGDRPSLNICVNGRAGLPGPLCNDFLSRSKVILVAAGRANHAGAGGFRGLVGNSAAFGNEAESNGVGRKDGSPDWTEFQRWAFPRVHAAHLWILGRDASWYAGHRDWTSRKIDPTDIDTVTLRREIAALLANPDVPEDDMTPQQWEYIQAMNVKLDRIEHGANFIASTLTGDMSDGADRLAEIWAQEGVGQDEIRKRLDSITERLEAGGPVAGGSAPIDYDLLADKVVERLAGRLQS